MAKAFGDQPFLHICECCGKTEILTSQEAFEQGWDYPGEGGLLPESAFGVVGPRTCGNCPISGTLWIELVGNKKKLHELSDKHKKTLIRILQEPAIYKVDDWWDDTYCDFYAKLDPALFLTDYSET